MMMNLDGILGHLDKLLMALPKDTPLEMRADVNKIIQSHKQMVNDNIESFLKGEGIVHSTESFKRKADFMTEEFKEKHGTTSNK